MKRRTLFAIVIGVMLGFMNMYLGYKISDLMFWVTLVLLSVNINILYEICKKD